MNHLYLGIDIGTTALKVAVFDGRSGSVAASAAARLPVRTAPDGTREQEPAELERCLRALTRRLRRRMDSPDWRRIDGIGLAAQGGSAILAEPESGRALTPMQLWNDTRPLALLPAISSQKPPAYWRRLSRLPGPGAGLARMLWLQERCPKAWRTEAMYTGAGEYAFFRLTGAWRQDAGNALQIGCYSVPHRRLTAAPLRLVGASLARVAPLRRGHETHPLNRPGSALLSLPEGIPVAGPYIDHEAGFLSATRAAARPLQCSLGTAWVGNFLSASAPPPSPAVDLVLPSPVDEQRSLVLRVMGAGDVTWQWARNTLAPPGTGDAMARAERAMRGALLPPDGLVAFPWLTQPNAHDARRAGNGAVFGINAHTTASDLMRAAVAGMAFEFAGLFEQVMETRGVDRVVLGGGASKGWFFQQLLASLFWPVRTHVTQDQEHAGARGCVYAFSRKAARSPLARLPVPPERLRAAIARQHHHYWTVREAVCPPLEDMHT